MNKKKVSAFLVKSMLQIVCAALPALQVFLGEEGEAGNALGQVRQDVRTRLQVQSDRRHRGDRGPVPGQR